MAAPFSARTLSQQWPKTYHVGMIGTTYEERRQLESLDAQRLAEHQLKRINALFREILPQNRFYAEKLSRVTLPLDSLDQLNSLPFTFKEELVNNPEGGDLAANLTYPIERYVRLHRTSGTRGRPLVVLDTADDWQWWIDGWQYVLDIAQIGPQDRALMAFSFGPFIGFWTAHDAVAARGAMVIPSGGLSSLARVEMIRSSSATVLFCTPTYALHLAEIARDNQIDPAGLGIRHVVVAGEPGGSIPAIRQQIQSCWNATLTDHAGATEVGPWGFDSGQQLGLHVNEASFIAEFLSVETGNAAGEGELSELVLTSLGRTGSPVIRYRTGDLTRPTWNSEGPCRFVLLEGGVLGRADDMMIIRGVNIFPTSVEQILRSFPEVVEYRMTAQKDGKMDSLSVEIEDRLDQPDRIAKELELKLGLKVEVRVAAIGSLPRFEGKGKRFVDNR